MRTHIYNTINTTGILTDRIVGLLTPHICIACGQEGAVLCQNCLATAGDPIPPRCAGCHKVTKLYKTCSTCLSWLPVKHVYVATSYDSLYEKLLHEFKFECRKQAAGPMSIIMYQQLKNIDSYDVVCPIPTAPSRVRMRGFDHTLLLCRELSKKSKLPTHRLLGRTSNSRQVGSSRRERLLQLENEFIVKNINTVKGKNILLIDDIMTTGASISTAAKVLRKAGAKSVSALVYAQKI